MLNGCVAPKAKQDLVKSSIAREGEFKALIDRIETEPRKSISWKEARRRLLKDNLGLQQSQQMLEDAERQTKRQWLTLVPRMSAFLNVNQSLSSLANLQGDKLNASVVTSLNIPNPFEFYGILYGAALQTQNARWSNELDKRRAFTELYAAFLDARVMSEEKVALERRRQLFSAGDFGDIAKRLYGFEREKDSFARRLLAHRQNVNRLLNTPGGNWDLSGDLPVISYRDSYRNFKIGPDFGKMALNLYAVRIESAIMQTQRVKYSQWPSINFGLSNPPLYSSFGNNRISGDDLNLFSGATKSFDVTDIGGRQAIQDAEKRLKFTRQQLQQSMEQEAARILQIRQTYDQLRVDERRLEGAIKRIEQPSSSEAEALLHDLELRSQLELQLIQIHRQIEQLDLQYLIWDERFWKF